GRQCHVKGRVDFERACPFALFDFSGLEQAHTHPRIGIEQGKGHFCDDPRVIVHLSINGGHPSPSVEDSTDQNKSRTAIASYRATLARARCSFARPLAAGAGSSSSSTAPRAALRAAPFLASTSFAPASSVT